ncbi:conserved Plasmodium protein, unknown function [Plasmodium ovale]|uniref:DNA-directed primase/polymerase protein n=2 Tax=Plasmodium ovale TaxID=36330 RepID=A0A1A8X263_PLAOA|nr:conserved Plasmodium protein, unknown function [Plasmodium ovale curtisi]SCP06356.1 conserved Plasmodium protein, unknown function [Plasmodium ovale]
MVIDAETFYGKRKNSSTSLEGNIEKYTLLKKIRNLSEAREDNNDVKKKIFYKQQDALSYYNNLLGEKSNNENFSIQDSSKKKHVIIYTEELENGKRCFILDSLFNFLKVYCVYALSLGGIYFQEEEGNNKGKMLNTCLGNSREEEEEEKESHLYELILSNEKRWLFFDIEYDIVDMHKNKEKVLFIFLLEFCLYIYTHYDIKICLNDVLILDSSTNVKISFHIIIKNIHTLNYDYYEYLIDYCNFFKNNMNKSENNFYDTYKNKQTKVNTQKGKKKLLLFDNENVLKQFVDIFIGHVISTIEQTKNTCIVNASTLFIKKDQDAHPNGSGSHVTSFLENTQKERTPVSEEPKGRTSMGEGTNEDKLQRGYTVEETWNHPNVEIQDRANNSNRTAVLNAINDFSEIYDVINAIQSGYSPIDHPRGDKHSCEKRDQLHEEEKEKQAYFHLYSHSAERVIDHYIDILKRKNKQEKKDKNYIILLYARKKIIASAEGRVGEEHTGKRRTYNVDEGSPIPNCRSVDKNNESDNENASDDNDNDNNYNGNDNDDEMMLLRCIIDNSVYSKNRNFRMIFSSKKKKRNKLLLSIFNVKKYDKTDINDLVLKSLVSFYNQDDLAHRVDADDLFLNGDDVPKYGQITTPNSRKVHLSKRSGGNIPGEKVTMIKLQNAHRSINIGEISYAHIHTILKIIFYWNFQLYRNFKKTNIYVNKFKSEICKEYFYKIIKVHNNIKYEHFKEYLNDDNAHLNVYCGKSYCEDGISNGEEERMTGEANRWMHSTIQNGTHGSNRNIEENSERKDGPLQKENRRDISPCCNLLNRYDKLFLQSEEFYTYVLDEYKKKLMNKSGDYTSFLINYFIYSILVNNEEYILNFRDNKYCKNKNLSHKSNHIYLIYNYRKNLFVQKCYDNECAYFVSNIYYL